MINSPSVSNLAFLDLPNMIPIMLTPKRFISLFIINTLFLTGGTHANSQSFGPGEVAVALHRCSPIEFVGSSAASTDEE
jgi:hypothetical protein